MKETDRLLHRFMEQHQYRVCEDEENHLVLRYQLSYVHVFYGDDEHFVNVVASGFEDVNSNNLAEVLVRCNTINNELRVVKVCALKDTVLATCGFYYQGEADFDLHLRHALDAVVCAKGRYYRMLMERLDI